MGLALCASEKESARKMTDAPAASITSREIAGPEPELTGVCSIDVAGCDRLEVVAALHEHEKAGQRPHSWPPRLLAEIDGFADDWLARHPGAAVRSVTYGVGRNHKGQACCVLVLHYRQKAPA